MSNGGVAMTIYLDEFFLVNFLMDLFILWMVGVLARQNRRWKQICSGAVLGGVYALIVLLPGGQWLAGWWGKLLCSLLMVLLAYPTKNWRLFSKCVAYFYGIALISGGATIASMYLFGQQFIQTWNGVAMINMDFQLFWLVAAVFAVCLLVFGLRQSMHSDFRQKHWLVQLHIGLGQEESAVTALVDTGNQLVEPITANPVVLIEHHCLWNLLPQELVVLLQAGATPDELFLAGAATGFMSRLRLIPYQSVGRQGMLLGFKPDWLMIEDGTNQVLHHEVIVALTKQQFSAQGSYQGLAQVELL